jgi:glycerol-3-phosphate acyltransferase PlsX
MLPIAVDAMGGDNAPGEIVAGARRAVEEFGIDVVLVGPADLDADGLSLIPATEVIGMGEDPAGGVRRKKDSTLVRAAEAVRDGKASAMVSAGNTGATMASALFRMGRIRGVSRPAIASVLPNPSGSRPTILIDAGANAECQPEWLVQFAQMGTVFAHHRFGISEPRVGLLSIGEESSKGNTLVKETHERLSAAPGVRFIGNVEGRDIMTEDVDVVVTDGFTGNVCLKISESLAEMLTAMIREELSRDVLSMAGAALSKRAFERMKKRVDYTEMGGAPLLGINGASIICHGASPVKAIKNGVRVAAEWVRNDVNEHIKTALEAEAVLAEGREGGRE